MIFLVTAKVYGTQTFEIEAEDEADLEAKLDRGESLSKLGTLCADGSMIDDIIQVTAARIETFHVPVTLIVQDDDAEGARATAQTILQEAGGSDVGGVGTFGFVLAEVG